MKTVCIWNVCKLIIWMRYWCVLIHFGVFDDSWKERFQTVFIRTTGHNKTKFTVVLTTMDDRSNLPPVILFRRKTLPKQAKFLSGVIVRANSNGWMDENWVSEWLPSTAREGRKGPAFKKPSLLNWDSFKAHVTACPMNVYSSAGQDGYPQEA